MWNTPSIAALEKLEVPKLYETEFIDFKDKLIYAHFFIGSADWYISEFDGVDLFYGYANLGDDDCAEWGYISFNELKNINVRGFEVEFDGYWRPTLARYVEKIKF